MKRWEMYLTLVAVIMGLILLSGCRCRSSVEVGTAPAQVKTGPPPHAPAHGYRAKHTYYYYPSSHVYFDVGRKLYFYYCDGDWQVGVSLPASISISVGERVTIKMASDKPYTDFEKHKVKYPPGQLKKKGKKPKGK